jgi:hypothetical protein
MAISFLCYSYSVCRNEQVLVQCLVAIKWEACKQQIVNMYVYISGTWSGCGLRIDYGSGSSRTFLWPLIKYFRLVIKSYKILTFFLKFLWIFDKIVRSRYFLYLRLRICGFLNQNNGSGTRRPVKYGSKKDDSKKFVNLLHGGTPWRTMHCRLCINCYGIGLWVCAWRGGGGGGGSPPQFPRFRNNLCKDDSAGSSMTYTTLENMQR